METIVSVSADASNATDNPLANDTTTASVTVFGYQQAFMVCLLSLVILIVVLGNTLVISAVITTRRLRTVTNCFVMSLAVADWLVGIFVMPPAVAYLLVGSWQLGWVLCDLWVSLDILLCTASILSLCAISVDRYLAITQPLSYSRKRRSKRLAFIMILIVWISSAVITAPPIFGSYKPDRENNNCKYNKNPGYVVYSAMGSFFIPMVVMLYVYVKISCVVAKRHDQLSHINTSYTKKNAQNGHPVDECDLEKFSEDIDEGNSRIRSQRLSRSFRSNLMPTENVHPASTKLLTVNTSYSFPNQRSLTPVRSSFKVRSSLPSRPVIDADHAILNYEPVSRVSSFRRETKTAQTLSIVMGGFILCWLPFFIFYLLTPFIAANDVTQLIMQYLTWLGWINSAINPFIYAFHSSDFRIAFWRLTIRRCQRSATNRSEFVEPHPRRFELG